MDLSGIFSDEVEDFRNKAKVSQLNSRHTKMMISVRGRDCKVLYEGRLIRTAKGCAPLEERV
jgi:hypothetical protein